MTLIAGISAYFLRLQNCDSADDLTNNILLLLFFLIIISVASAIVDEHQSPMA